MKTIKKTKAKRLLSLLLALMMIILAMPMSGMSVFAAVETEFNYYVLDDGTAQITSYYGSEKNIEIPSEIYGYKVTQISGLQSPYVVSVKIPNTVVVISEYAFSDCTSLANIYVDDNNSEYSDIDGVLFNYEKTELLYYPGGRTQASYTVPDGIINFQYNAFENCENLKSISLPNSLADFDFFAFLDCKNLLNIYVSDSNPGYCDIDGVLFNKGKTQLLFYPRGKEGTYAVPDGVTDIGTSAFRNCIRLTAVELPNSLLNIDTFAFDSCTSMEKISFSNNLKSLGSSAFENCTSLKSVKFPVSLESIGSMAFAGCSSLDEIELPDKITELGAECLQDTAYYRNDSNWEHNDDFSALYIDDYLIECNLLNTCSYSVNEGTRVIADSAFAHESGLLSVKLPNSLKTIGSCAFESCSSLNNVEMPNSVEKIGTGAFEYSTSLSEISFSDNLTDIGSSVLYDTAIFKDQSNWKGGVLYINDYLFASSNNILTENLVIEDGTKVISDSAFYYADILKEVYIPGTVKHIGHNSFNSCYNLELVNISEGVESIGMRAFASCDLLTQATIPESVSRIEEKAFGFENEIGGKSIVFNYTGYDEEGKKLDFQIYGYEGTAAETYASENDFEFIALDKAADESTGISVSEKELNVIPYGAQLKAMQLSAEEDKIAFDISLIKDGVEVQPNGKVTVKIPVHKELDGSLLKVYREETDGTFTDMNAYFANGYMVFTTDHFSKYIITTEEPSLVLPGDINGDGKVTAVDARWVLQIAAGTREVTEDEKKSVDLNKDGKVTAVDARWVLQIAAGTRKIS